MPENDEYTTKEQALADVAETKKIAAEFSDVAGRLDHALARLHKKRADKMLGYKSWRAFIEHVQKTEALEKLTGHKSGLKESQTRPLPASAVPDVAAKTREKVKNGMDVERAHAAAVAEVAAEHKLAKASLAEETPASSSAPSSEATAVDKPEEVPISEGETEAAASLQEASEALEAETVAEAPSDSIATPEEPRKSADEKWLMEAVEFLRSCPDMVTLDALTLDFPSIVQTITEDLAGLVRMSA
jgi:prophage DNA circulation protein